VTHFVAGLGTSGTFTGTGRRLRQAIPSVTLVSVQPDSPFHGLEGMKHLASAMVPAIYDPSLADRNLSVPTELALQLTRRLAREAGIFAGPSSGAALAGAMAVAADLKRGTIVTIFADGGDRYASEAWWQEPGSVVISEEARRDIDAHSRRAYPHECCGALIGAATGRVTSALSLDNVTTLERRRRFLVSPEAYRAAETHADNTGQLLLGFYHSHPDHPAEPSAFDLEQAWPNLSYVIASVTADRVPAIRSWRLQPDRSRFIEEPILKPGDLHVREDSDSNASPSIHRPVGQR
jgi:proteasome lid subunit RPN8/RPN11